MGDILQRGGLKPAKIAGNRYNPNGNSQYRIASGYSTSIFQGDIVYIAANGYIEKVTATDDFSTVGVFIGVQYNELGTGRFLNRNWWEAGTAATAVQAYVIDDAYAVFQASADGSLDVSAIAKNIAVVQAPGNTTFGQSGVVLDAGSLGTADTLPLKVIGFWDGEEIGSDYPQMLVVWNGNHQFGGGGGSSGTITASQISDSTLSGREVLTGTPAEGRDALELGTMAVQDASTVAITGGSITGITDLAVADGGTGASNGPAALVNLGGAPLASPAFTGIPTAPTATFGTNTTQLATCEFVQANAGGGSGDVNGPTISAVGNVAIWDNTTGDLLADSGVAYDEIVIGPTVSGANNIAVFADTTGVLLADSSVSIDDVVFGPTISAAGNVAVFDNTTGDLLEDSGIVATTLVVGPGFATSTHVVVFDGSTGSLVADSNIAYNTIVIGPSSATSANFAVYDGTTGKLIADSGYAVATGADFRSNTSSKVLSPTAVFDAAGLVTLTDTTNIALDMSSGFNFVVTLGGARTLSNPTNTKVGQSGVICVQQDSTGGRTLAYGTSYEFPGGTAPTISAGAGDLDVLSYFVYSSTRILMNIAQDFS